MAVHMGISNATIHWREWKSTGRKHTVFDLGTLILDTNWHQEALPDESLKFHVVYEAMYRFYVPVVSIK